MINEEKIKIIPIELPFLKILAQYFVAKFNANIPDFSKILVIFPSERNKFYFRRYLLETAEVKGIIPPIMLTMEELVRYIYERIGGKQANILHSIERNFILKKTIDDLKVDFYKNLPFLHFISIGNRLLDFFDELSQEKIDIGEIEKRSAELHFPERYIKQELPILKKVYQAYRKNLAEAGYLDEIDKIEKVYKDYDSKIFADFESIIIAGIAALTSFEKFIIKKILEELPAELVLHSGTIEELSNSNDVFSKYFLHYELLKFLNVDIKLVESINHKSVVRPVIHINFLETMTKQTFYLIRVVLEAIKKYKDPHRIGIVLTDQALLFPITEMLKSYGFEYNLSAGIPFNNQIFYSFLNHLYEAVVNNLHHTAFFVFLQHPLIKNAIIDNVPLRPLVYRLRNQMIKENLNYFDKKFFNTKSDFTPLLNFLEKCFTTVQQNLSINEYIENLHYMLNEVLLYNSEIIKKNLPGIKEFFDELEHLAQLRIENNNFNSGIDMLEFILSVLENGRYRIEGEPLKGIQLIGVLEARNLDFDCIIIPSMNEGIFPRRSEKDIFINPALRKAMGLITSQERENLYYYYFTQLISGKKEVFLSYIAEEKSDIPSRFIMMLKSAGYKVDGVSDIFERGVIKIPEHSVKKNSKIMKALLKMSQRGLSPSLLRTYKACPYKFYLQYLLGIQEPETISEEFDATTWGLIFHKVAKEFYKEHFPKGYFDRRQKKEAIEKFEELLNKAMHSREYIAVRPKPVTYFNLELYKIHIKKFIEYELDRFAEGYRIIPEHTEEEVRDSIEIAGRSIGLKGYFDRIDIKDGKYYIIDYKTGVVPAKKTYTIGEEFLEFQLPLYALMFLKDSKKEIGGLIYYKIGTEPKTFFICKDNGVIDYLNSFREKILIPTIEEMLDMDILFSQTANEDNCMYCPYGAICGRSV